MYASCVCATALIHTDELFIQPQAFIHPMNGKNPELCIARAPIQRAPFQKQWFALTWTRPMNSPTFP